MKLTDNETIVKQWTYAKGKEGRDKISSALTLTARRLISAKRGKRKLSQSEIPLKSIKGVRFGVERQASGKAILMIVLGVFTLIAVVGIALIVLGIKRMNLGAFEMSVSVEGAPELLGAVASDKKTKK